MNFNTKKEEEYFNTILKIIVSCNRHKSLSSLYSNVEFDINTAIQIAEEVNKLLKKEPSVLQITTKAPESSDFIIVGDIHGNLNSLARIFTEKGYPPQTRYLFLGDYVDRGENSCEVLVLLYSLKCLFPNDIFLIRGNHEFKDMTDIYGFKAECIKRIPEKSAENFYNKITDTFASLPICAILNDSIFCVHGGISALVENREQLLNVKKVGHLFCRDDSVQAEFLWNDPSDETKFYEQSSRGIGCIFGLDALNIFLTNMDFKLVIRGHQSVATGYEWPLGEDAGILTVFSSLDYCGTYNDGAIAIIPNEDNDNSLVKVQTIYVLTKRDFLSFKYEIPSSLLEKQLIHMPVQTNLQLIDYPKVILA
ncbi:hypothetical protein M9Y10_032361 [Tritrichomonas musculus]|uniref:Serine/threonine-protein phosphatase n=1 Tax=Tritrichomonas musculus TaxID=1915356 RepID=A0ABR2GY93_9EUKA